MTRQLRPAELREKKRLKQETLVRQRCVEEGCPQEELVLEEVVERVQEDKAASPELRATVVEVSQLLADWGEVQKESEEGGIPIKKAWFAHIANNPRVAYNLNPELRVELGQHLLRVVYGCLVPSRICDQHKVLRWQVGYVNAWNKAQEALQRAAETEPRLQKEVLLHISQMQKQILWANTHPCWRKISFFTLIVLST